MKFFIQLLMAFVALFMMVAAKRCPNCPPSESPVCAQAENEKFVKTFSNICLLNKENCITGKIYTIKHEGKCGTYGHSSEVEE